ncbi:hypothetical protein [Mycobacterium sherrisii]|uniref:Uncharacterized protein n=1 Tax=Mycobacterium sherrisii TaxID=243061 RepID=A0A1E3T1C9_9MYCO|nr:hypothetical protein [Mycobacterium sherrisii]MCV7029360.1 hypothetical protein [Mycobacterium sherrisii]MEC4765528.1 hypothetical protein [Mycobacterium sherrisii]ODR08236.1 hypothetical protein BHQ21_07465 [Mycobacterium sherrisii]ORW73401.1 hypothetical protein AWC25_17785 [Mycobacterium sherrisii]
MKTLLEYFVKYFDVLYLDPRYRITDSRTIGVSSNNASLTITGPILSWELCNDRGQFLLGLAPTALATSDNWFTASLIKQYLNGQDEVEHASAADEITGFARMVNASKNFFPTWPISGSSQLRV